MSALPEHLCLDHRTCLPEDQRFLLEAHPRAGWDAVAHLAGAASAWLHFHAGFRRGANDMTVLIDAVRAGDMPAHQFKARFGRIAGGFLSGLEGHHGIEDDYYFPMFLKAEPRLRHGFEILDSDHNAIHEAIHTFADATGAILRGIEAEAVTLTDDGRFAAEALSGTLVKFRRNLLRHLDDEEEIVVPLMIMLSQAGAAQA